MPPGMGPGAQPDVFSLDEMKNIPRNPYNFDFAEINKIYRSIEYHNYQLSKLGSGLQMFFAHANSGQLFPPTTDPYFNVTVPGSKKEIHLCKGRYYLAAMFGACAPSAVDKTGSEACSKCQNSAKGRYKTCRQAFDGAGNPIASGACMSCYSTGHWKKCSLSNGPEAARGDEDMNVDEEENAQGNYELEFDVEEYHHLSTTGKFDLEVVVHTPLPVLGIRDRDKAVVPVGIRLRIGVRLPGTNFYQIEDVVSPDSIFTYKADADDLRVSVKTTELTEAMADAPAGTYIFPDIHISSLMRTCVDIKCRSLSGNVETIIAGGMIYAAEAKYLPNFVVFFYMTNQDHPEEERQFFPLPQWLMDRHLALGNFEYATDSPERDFSGFIDFTEGEQERDIVHKITKDVPACGSHCQSMVFAPNQIVRTVFSNPLMLLTWGETERNEIFVEWFQQLIQF